MPASLSALMFFVPLSLPLRRSDAEKCEENQTPMAENHRKKLAERVGVPERVFSKANGINGFALISRNRNDLAASNLRRRFRPFAGICRFSHFNDTRNGTRRETLGRHLPRTPRQLS
jgi:hypothetical protein